MLDPSAGSVPASRGRSLVRPEVEDRHRRQIGPNVGDRERIASAAAGAALLSIALVRRGLVGAAAGAAGAILVLRGATGRCSVYRTLGKSSAAQPRDAEREITIARSVTIGAEPDAVRELLRDPGRIRAIFDRITGIDVEGDVWHLAARAPGGRELSWNALRSEEGDTIAWRSQPEAIFEHELRITLVPAPGARGTEVRATLRLRPPGGVAGSVVAHVMSGITARGLGSVLRRLQMALETGEIATTAGQPAGPRSTVHRLFAPLRVEPRSEPLRGQEGAA